MAATREILSAETTVSAALAHDPTQLECPIAFLGTPRKAPKALCLPNGMVTLNDQQPLSERQCAGLSCTFAEFVSLLNTFVYFWPGTIDEPKPPRDLASSFRDKYREYGCLRVPTADLWADDSQPLFCGYNSGAPQARDRLTRGPELFASNTQTSLKTEFVAEVVFANRISLPATSQWRIGFDAAWEFL